MILKSLLRRFTRSILTVSGIAIGVAAVVALGSIAEGISTNYGASLGLSNDLLLTEANALDVVFSSIDQDVQPRIEAIADVSNVDPGVFGWIAVEEMPFFLVYGYEANSPAMEHYYVVEGKSVAGPGQIALGRRAADSLKLQVDDTLRLYGQPYRIVGIYETGQAIEESGGVVTLADAQSITGKERQVSLFQVGVRPGADIDAVMARIETLDGDLAVSKSSEYQGGEEWTNTYRGLAWGISGIAVLIGGLGMMSAMVMSVMERTREIGTLRALGWSRWQVLRLILGESLALSSVGGVAGILLGVGLAWLAGQTPGAGAFLEGNFSPGIFIQGFATALSLGLIGGLYPAWAAANLQPIEALSYEGGATEASGPLTRIGDQSFRNLWRRRTRTLLSMAGIGIGVATLVMLGSLIEGVVAQLNGLAGSGGAGNLTVMQRDTADMSLSSLDERIARQIGAMDEVEDVSPAVLGFVSTAEFPIFILMGLEPNSSAMTHFQLSEGRYIQRPNEILLGKVASETYELAVGDALALYENRYRVVGIYETGVAYEDGGGLLALRESQRLFDRGRTVSFLFVDVGDPAQAERVRTAIEQRFDEAQASLSSEFAQNTNDIQSTMAMATAIRVLALLVGGIVVANTMIMSVFERTREIGTLRALGWSQRRVLGQILQESLYLCLLAAAFGSLLGVVLLTGIAQIPMASAFITPAWNAPLFLSATATALVLGLLGGMYPAWRASRLRPVEALQYE